MKLLLAKFLLILLTFCHEGCSTAHPNKQVSLNGTWEVAISDSVPTVFPSKVPVPGVITMAIPHFEGDLDATTLKDSLPYNYVWYRYEFDLNESNNYAAAILKIRAKYNALVILNDKELGYDPFTTYSHGEFDASQALHLKGHNVLLVRVGSWNTASAPSKENSAEWWRNSRTPGIWDDVCLELEQAVAIPHIKVLPDVKKQQTQVTVKLHNYQRNGYNLKMTCSILDHGRTLVEQSLPVQIQPGETTVQTIILPCDKLKCWTPGKEGNPQLYELKVVVEEKRQNLLAVKSTTFGYRQIETQGRDVLLNGQRIFFRAENIAFPRALNRWASVMFDEKWVRHFLREAVHTYNFNYLRFHLGHAYSLWYRIADEEGIMLQDEWRYMHDDEPQGEAREEAIAELTRWVEQNVNHASIVAWDQENEGNVRLEDLKAAVRQYDPSRLWGEDDYDAKHVYEHSENIVSKLDYPISATKPSTVLESCRLWLNEQGLLEPRESFKTSRTASAWGFYHYTKEDIARLQSDIHADLGTYYRSQRLQAWAPFALLSGCVNGHNYFLGDIADSLVPQANLITLKALNEPLGTSIDMLQAREWYKDQKRYAPGSRITKRAFVWNDFPETKSTTLYVQLKSTEGDVISETSQAVTLTGGACQSYSFTFTLPTVNGCYLLQPSLKTPSATIDGPCRRILVADEQYIPDPALAFGGRITPTGNTHSIFEHFTGENVPASTQTAIAQVIHGASIDKINIRKEKGKTVYKIQYTVYKDISSYRQYTGTFDEQGQLIRSEYSDALIYVSLPQPIREAIMQALGTVPVDESKIIRRQENGDSIYEISLVGKSEKYRLNITDGGLLKEKTVLKKKP